MEVVMSAQEPENRDEAIGALAHSLYIAMQNDTKGCQWREACEAIGLLLKLFATLLLEITNANDEEAFRLLTEMHRCFNAGYKKQVPVIFTK
jgi:hypothetical protein